MKFKFLTLASKMRALFSSEYRDLKDKVNNLLKNSQKLQKKLIEDLNRRTIIKESVRVLSEIHHNLKYGASVVSLSEFHGLVQDLSFNKHQLAELEQEIKDELEKIEDYSRDLLIQTEQIKTVSKALERFGVLIKL